MKITSLIGLLLGLVQVTTCPAQVLTNATNLGITKSWSQQPQGWTYQMSIRVPAGEVPLGGFPICILLHGNGGNGPGTINQFSQLIQCHALIAPSGYANSWNICGEPSDAPDVEMIGELIESLQTFTNVDPDRIRIVGFSNGSALANSVFIENGNPGLDTVAAVVSQLSTAQYHDGAYHRASGTTNPSAPNCGYDEPVVPFIGRRYLSIANMNDGVIPYDGGQSGVGLTFIDAQDATYLIAQSQGHTGNQLTGSGQPIGGNSFAYGYLDDSVVHVRGFAGHGSDPVQEAFLVDFLQDCEAPPVCPSDLNQDGVVGGVDLAQLLAVWGNTVDPGTGADLTGDGQIGGEDLAQILAYWGTCF